jgi:hypothetical protein
MNNVTLRVPALALASSLVASSVVLVACGGGGSPAASLAGVQPQSARATPAASCSYAHVWITVTSIRVLGDGGWQDIALTSPARVDLLAASGGLLQSLGASPLQPGHYSEVRLVLAADGNAVQPTGGNETALKVPSGSSSGFKLMGDITVVPDTSGDVVLDGFDPCSSIVATGNGAYNLKPEAQASMQAVVQAGPEVPTTAGTLIPVPGGGYALVSTNAPTWTVQRFDASGNPAATANIAAPANSTFVWFAALTGGGFAATWIEPTSNLGEQQVQTQAWDASGNPLNPVQAVATVVPGKLSHPAALPQIAPLTGGGYVIVWGLPPSDDGVYAQRFTAAGLAAAPAVRATDAGTGSLGVTGLAAGGYLVTWGRFGSSSGGVQAYSAADVPLAATQSAGSNGDGGGPPIPVVQALTGGGAVIAWQALHEHVMMQQVTPDGTPLAPAQIVDDQTASPVFAYIAVGALPDGGSVIAWAEGGNMYARRYTASGSPAGPQTKINLVTTQPSFPVSIAVRADGSFEIRWSDVDANGVRQPYVRTFPAGALVG